MKDAIRQLYYSLKSVWYIRKADRWLKKDKSISIGYMNLAVEFNRFSDIFKPKE